MSAGGENPFQPHGIHSRTVRGVCSLEHNKCRDRVHRVLESSVEKTGAVRSGQNPSIAESRVPHAGVLGAARNRAAAARPNLQLMTALLGAILGDGERSGQEESQKECEKKRYSIPNGWCHKQGQSRKKERYANRSQETNRWPAA